MEQLVFNALHKAATPVNGTTPQEFASSEEARDSYIALVMKELFPNFQMSSSSSSVVVPVITSPVKEKKKRAPKEKKADEIPLPKSPAADAEPAAAGAASPKEKKKRAPLTEEAKAATKAKREAKRAPNTDVDALANAVAAMTLTEEKPVKAKKAKVAEDANLAKMDPTWKKHLKTVAKAQGKEVTKDLEAELLSYLNHLTKEEFAGKKAEEHVTEFLKPQTGSNAAAEPVEQKMPIDLDIVEFNGHDYFVNPDTKRVYEGEGTYDDDTGAWTSYKPVGYVGMAAFAEMKLE